MKGIDVASVVAGVVFVVGGLVLSMVSLFGLYFLLIYGVPALIIGIVILFTLRKQEYIEPIKGASATHVAG